MINYLIIYPKFFFNQFVNNLSASLLCNIFDIFNFINFCKIFVTSHTEKKSSSNFTELFHESWIQVIREQDVAQFLKLSADNAERFKNSTIKFCNF